MEQKRQLGVTHPAIMLNMVVTADNAGEIEDLRNLARKLGADTVRYSSYCIAYENGAPADMSASKSLLGRYDKVWRRQAKIPCAWAWNRAIINWDGSVIPCAFHHEGKIVLGNVFQESFRSIWNGPKAREFRSKLLKQKVDLPICRDCPGTLD